MRTAKRNRRTDSETKQIEDLLRPLFPDTEVYRYNSASLRIRIIDSRFVGKSDAWREKTVMPLIRQLPEETQADITVLLLLAPAETETSLMNLEFNNPSPSKL